MPLAAALCPAVARSRRRGPLVALTLASALLLSALPAAAGGPVPVTVSTQRSNQGWRLIFHVADAVKDLREIRYRFDQQGDFRSAGVELATNPNTGAAFPQAWTPPAVGPGHAGRAHPQGPAGARRGQDDGAGCLQARLRGRGPARRQVLALQNPEDWASSYEYEDGDTAFMLTTILGFKDALREIRYSTNGCTLGERYAFDPWKDLVHPPKITEGRPYVILPKTTRSACLQLLFSDGTKTEPQEFQRGKE
jgi:hypothetical protein